jgi:predicted regulator of Ras-like GTPase activity (Roadblock/LC7/MglB family)
LSGHVFLSYSRKNTEAMQRIDLLLRKQGIPTWMDHQLSPGTRQWKIAIERAIEESSVVLALLSPEAKQSEWVDRELEYARMQHKTVIPVIVEGDPQSSVPFELITSQWINLVGDNFEAGWLKILETLQTQHGLQVKSSAKVLHDALKQLSAQIPQLSWISLLTVDGLTVAFYGPQGTEEDRVAAMGASNLSLNERIAIELSLGNYHRSVLIGEVASCFMAPLGEDHLLIFAVPREFQIQAMLDHLDEMVSLIQELL